MPNLDGTSRWQYRTHPLPQSMVLVTAIAARRSVPCLCPYHINFVGVSDLVLLFRFSRQSIFNYEPLIRQYAGVLCQRISEFAGRSQPLIISDAFPAFTGDIMMEVAFGFCYKQLQSPNFDSFHEAFLAIGSSAHITGQFPWFTVVRLG